MTKLPQTVQLEGTFAPELFDRTKDTNWAAYLLLGRKELGDAFEGLSIQRTIDYRRSGIAHTLEVLVKDGDIDAGTFEKWKEMQARYMPDLMVSTVTKATRIVDADENVARIDISFMPESTTEISVHIQTLGQNTGRYGQRHYYARHATI